MEPQQCSHSLLISLPLRQRLYGLVQMPLLGVALQAGAVWASDRPVDANLPLPAKNTSLVQPAAPWLDAAPGTFDTLSSQLSAELLALPSAPTGTLQSQSIAAPTAAPIKQATAKQDFLAAKPSRKASSLMALPKSTRTADVNQEELIPTPASWTVATTSLPLLTPENNAAKAAVAQPAEAVVPANGANGAALIASAPPGGLELPPVFCPNPDPELGCIQPIPGLSQSAPILFLSPRVDFFRSDNLLLGIDPVNAGLVRPNITLLAIPPIGPNTFILASVDGAFNRYFEVPQFNYDEFRVRVGILQRLSPQMSVEFGWTNQQLFIASNEIRGFPSGTRFLNDQAIRLELSRRDSLTDRLSLTSIYQFRVGFSDPADRSRILNVAFLSLNWDLNPARTIQAAIDYQFSAASYTVVRRTDIFNQLLGRFTFNAFRNSQLSVYGGASFGGSTEPGINFNSFVLGVSVSVNWALF